MAMYRLATTRPRMVAHSWNEAGPKKGGEGMRTRIISAADLSYRG